MGSGFEVVIVVIIVFGAIYLIEDVGFNGI